MLSQMVRMLEIVADYLQHRRFVFQRLDGSMNTEIYVNRYVKSFIIQPAIKIEILILVWFW